MDVLIVDLVDPTVMRWLADRHALRYEPDLVTDLRALRTALSEARAVVLPPSVSIDATLLQGAPRLQAIGLVGAGPEHVDLKACAEAGVSVVRSTSASAAAEAEFMIGALLALLRRVPVLGADGARVGRELGGAVVGLVGLAPAARVLSQLLAAFGSKVVGYDPAVHASDAVWGRWAIEPLPLDQLLERSDAVCVQLPYYSRYRGLLGERFLPRCKPDQVLVSLSHSSLFDTLTLAEVLASGRMAAAWFDSLEPGELEPGQPLRQAEHLQVTPRVAATTRESRVRAAWSVARRLDDILAGPQATPAFRPTAPGDPPDPEAFPESG